jgi:hypothetical protein
MYSQAALQLCPNQKDWDLLIPIYFGNRDEPFDSSKLSAMAVQVKNSKRGNLISTGMASIEFPTKPLAIIYLLLDLGLKENRVNYQVERVKKKPIIVHCIHAIGYNASTFECPISDFRHSSVTTHQPLNV